MFVRDLLEEKTLGIDAKWAPEHFMENEISGVITTDLPDPSRYLESGRILLTGLVWWRSDDPADELEGFVRRLVRADVAALLAGEAAHGPAPEALVAACRSQGVALLSVPSSTGFHQVTEYVHRNLTGGSGAGEPSSATASLGERARRELIALVSEGVGTHALLERLRAALGATHCEIVTDTGRVVARTAEPDVPGPDAREAPAAGVPGRSPADTWWLRATAEGLLSPRVLEDAAEVVGLERARLEAGRAEHRRSADHLASVLRHSSGDRSSLVGAVSACGLSAKLPLLVVAARLTGGEHEWARLALEEALRPVADRPAVGLSRAGEAVAVVSAPTEGCLESLREAWEGFGPLLDGTGADGDRALHAGVSGPVGDVELLPTALAQARFALDSARGSDPAASSVVAAGEMRGMGGLISGLPAEVRRDYHRRTLGRLLDHDQHTGGELVRTLRVFLAENGSWVRTARRLHVHVNTVHYRVGRIEELTGRDLGGLDDRLDLRVALMCGPDT